MLIKSPSLLHVFARQKEEVEAKPLSRDQWVQADRIVMAILFIAVIFGAILFS
ncbi:MAG: hypothetical protein V4687_15265 [Bacteroidota bacterium]